MVGCRYLCCVGWLGNICVGWGFEHMFTSLCKLFDVNWEPKRFAANDGSYDGMRNMNLKLIQHIKKIKWCS